jgi:hypothetical protein
MITPLISFGADQTENIRRNVSLNGGPVHLLFHLLDELRCPQVQQHLAKCIILLLDDMDTTMFIFFIFIFLSPQAIINNPLCWRHMINSCIAKWLLSMLCIIDEVHLFFQFGLTF